MTEWVIDIQSMVPQGQLSERMLVGRVDRVAGTVELIPAPTMTTHRMHESFDDSAVFMTGYPMGGRSEIDAFLQAMLEAAWARGLRPSKFDPSAGELAAVQAHLADMRRIALAEGKVVPDAGPTVTGSDVASDIGAGEGARW